MSSIALKLGEDVLNDPVGQLLICLLSTMSIIPEDIFFRLRANYGTMSSAEFIFVQDSFLFNFDIDITTSFCQ